MAVKGGTPSPAALQEMAALQAEIEKRGLPVPEPPKQSPKYRAWCDRYWDDPAGFVKDCISFPKGKEPAPYQLEALIRLVTADAAGQRRVALRGPHGLGKSAMASWAILWFALTRDGAGRGDWKIPTTASGWRQLTKYLWPEVHKWAPKIRWGKVGRPPFKTGKELQKRSLVLDHGEAFALASDKADLIEGAHADHILYLLDEAKIIPDPSWNSVEGALSSGNCYALAVSTPGEPQGRFYDIHRRARGLENWWARHVTLNEAIKAGMVNQEWPAQMVLLWGEDSAAYKNRVLGEFAESGEDAVIPLAWVEAANERWHVWADAGRKMGDFLSFGVDVGRGGDKTVIAPRMQVDGFGIVYPRLHRSQKADTMDAAGRVQAFLARGGVGVIDADGLGAGTYDRLRETGANVEPFNASKKTKNTDRTGLFGFVDTRAAAWWAFREALDPAYGATVALPPDSRLTGDLTAPHWKPQSDGRVRVESKESISERLNRSTDDGDAVVMGNWAGRAHKRRKGRSGVVQVPATRSR